MRQRRRGTFSPPAPFSFRVIIGIQKQCRPASAPVASTRRHKRRYVDGRCFLSRLPPFDIMRSGGSKMRTKAFMWILAIQLLTIATFASPSASIAAPMRPAFFETTSASRGGQLQVPQISFRADRTTINPGECATLMWDVDYVSAVYLDGRGVVGHDSTRVCPGVTTTFTLLVKTASQDIVSQVTISVAGIPSRVYFYAENNNITLGQCTTLRWGVANVDSFWLDGRRVYDNPGARIVCPNTTTTYTFFATYGDAGITRQVTIYVSPTTIPQPSSTSFSLINFHTQMCLEASDAYTVVQAACDGSSQQLWTRATWDYRLGQLVNVSTNKCLDATDIDIIQSDCRVSPVWYLTPYGSYYNIAAKSRAMSHAAAVVQQGEYYEIRTSSNYKCIDVDAWNHDNPGRIIFWDCAANDHDNQLWTMR